MGGGTPSQAIIAGIMNAAKSIAIDDKIGTIEKGKLADLLVLREDPTVDITAIRISLEKIILNGLFILE